MRIWEAIEAGSIPVYILANDVDLEFTSISRPPVVIAKTWKEATAAVVAVLDNSTLLDEMQEDIKVFWKKYKEQIQNGVRADVDKAFMNRYRY
jgi:hypothetical protein